MAKPFKYNPEKCAANLARVLGKKYGNCCSVKKGKYKCTIGCWQVDTQPTYGGSVIEEIVTPGGGVRHPFGDTRSKPTAFCEAIFMAVDAVLISKGKIK